MGTVPCGSISPEKDSLFNKITSITYYVSGGICLPLSIIVIINLCMKQNENASMGKEVRFILLSIFIMCLIHSLGDLIPASYLIEKSCEHTHSKSLMSAAQITCTVEACFLALSTIGYLGNGLTVTYSVYKIIFKGEFSKKEAIRMCLVSWIISIVLCGYGIAVGYDKNNFDYDKYCWLQDENFNAVYNVVLCSMYLIGIALIIVIFIKIDKQKWKDNWVTICLLLLSYLMLLMYFVDCLIYLVNYVGNKDHLFYKNEWFNFFVNFTESLSCLILAYIFRDNLPKWMTCSIRKKEIVNRTLLRDKEFMESFAENKNENEKSQKNIPDEQWKIQMNESIN